ncbi:hypothetical protein TTHERM_00189280 (macronuclear) [Tetrahymena thermophila SB210]|uniref:Uncharacterized protein n=1 Tax=Tetrahymena thermophila (strain SB210) TaxID=312017 RepID=I7LUZ5_TETTS|nr:hypothetical protein TTHERM_00189280 [Tetrahymena thermophila SB210]EAR96359.2 hypothetical protein TTHERM_00189280 [Tetrahymena thermophila SB210]|eukprot:XP_001016604.2 hypothetical protein TTHERM_00189280 [Tetrahymena thermophila SB210]
MDSSQKQIKRIKKLYNILYELNFFRSFVIQDKCNLPNYIDPNQFTDDDEQQEILSEFLMPFIKPGDKHLDLIEFLIKKISKDTFEKCVLYEDDPYEFRVKRIRIMSSRLGILGQSKFSKNLNFSKVIEGKSGVEPSVKFIYELSKLTKSILKTKRQERELTHRQLFLECTYTMNNLINVDINPFSVDFPIENELLQHDDIQFYVNNIEEEVNKDNELLEGIQAERSNNQQDDEQSQLMDAYINQIEKDVLESFELCKEDLASYKNQLDFLKDQILKIFDLGRKETSKLQKKIQQQDFDKQDEKIITIDSKFQKIYRNLQQIQDQLITCNNKYHIDDRLQNLVEKITQFDQDLKQSNNDQV